MGLCFVIQPFDGGSYDRRYEEVFKPAIEKAGLEPYRVDLDPKVDVPIESIEENIKNATACVADITTDNPNVWYELGYAFATAPRVIMVCSRDRQGKFPFDIQHRTIITYNTDSPSDFQTLEKRLLERLKSVTLKNNTLNRLKTTDIPDDLDISKSHVLFLSMLASELTMPQDNASAHFLRSISQNWGLEPIAYHSAILELQSKGMIAFSELSDNYGGSFQAIGITNDGWNWIIKNNQLFNIQSNDQRSSINNSDNEVPF